MQKNSVIYAFGAYIVWGIIPIYWKWLHLVNPLQVIGHRIVWSFIFVMGFIFTTYQGKAFGQAISNWRVFWIYFVAAVLIGINWLVYVWAVNSNFIVEASLGYFIFPLLSILLGVIFFRERLRSLQWLTVALATLGVIYLSFVYGHLPWISLALAITFGLYGLVKKLAPLSSVFGLAVETGVLFIPAVIYLGFVNISGGGAFLQTNSITNLLLVGAGVVTTIPLLLFASAARTLPLSMLGILQYIAPTLAFLLGVLFYKEPFSQEQLIGFGVIWAALALFTFENLYTRIHFQESY